MNDRTLPLPEPDPAARARPLSPALSASLRTRTEAIDALLPQTQCTRCGYPNCHDYAAALAAGQSLPNRCPPGGQDGADRLARLMGVPALPLDAECGREGPRLVARIDPAQCIGCVKCILACPVDAIIGAPRRMHTILPALCTGCELCVPPCPVDCIVIESLPPELPWTQADADSARERFEARNCRRRDDELRQRDRLASQALGQRDRIDTALSGRCDTSAGDPTAVACGDAGEPSAAFAAVSTAELERKHRIVAAAIERARQRQASRK